MSRAKEQGVALILTMILLVVLSVMAVSLLFISQTETWSSMNYQLMSQARYGAEAGLNQAANYLLYGYTLPGGALDPLSNYVLTVSPVTYKGSSVVLSASSNTSPNYPVAGSQTGFNKAAQGNLTAGNTVVNYSAYVTLLSMRQVAVYGSPTPATIQTWQITSDGTINGVRSAQVEVSAVLEPQYAPVFNYAVFADSSGCSALTFGGGGITNSYDSSNIQMVSGAVVTQASDGNVGTNGNLGEVGSPTTINGSLSTPRTGVGTCTSGNVTAWTDNQGKLTGGLVELPQPINYPTPQIPPPGSTDLSLNKSPKCPSGVNAIPGCRVSGSNMTIPPGSYGNISITAGANLHLSAGTYNINSLTETGTATVTIDSGPVIVNVAGNGIAAGTDVVKLVGNGLVNSTLISENLQILYAGSGTVQLAGGTQSAGLVYAPNASLSFTGNADWYGSVISQVVRDMGGTAVHYDRSLKNWKFIVGPSMLDSFTWKKF